MSSLPAESVDNVGVLQFPVGIVLPYLGTGQPTGWYLLKVGGAVELINSYPTLFGLVGTRYGGDGITTFGTPPAELYLRGPNATHALWTFFGEDEHLLTQAELAGHGHGVNDPGHSHGVNDPGHSHRGYSAAADGAAGAARSTWATPGGQPTTADTTGLTVTAAPTGVTIAAAGGDVPHNNLPRTHAVNFIVKT